MVFRLRNRKGMSDCNQGVCGIFWPLLQIGFFSYAGHHPGPGVVQKVVNLNPGLNKILKGFEFCCS